MRGFNLMNLIEPVSAGVSRRAFFTVPFAFAGIAAFAGHKDRVLPDASENGSGDEVTIVLFDDNGQRKGAVKVKKLVMSDAEWRKILDSGGVPGYAAQRDRGVLQR